MHYICIENNKVVSVLNYEPNVPKTVQVVPITDDQAKLIQTRTHYWDNTESAIKLAPAEVIQARAQAAQNTKAKSFLQNTDWQVLRHIRQLHLGIPTSLTSDEYTQLELDRQQAAASIRS
jgi:hypothetical protein